MRRTPAATRSAPSMSSIGQRVLSPASRSPARDCRRAVIAATSSRTTAWKRSRIGASRSGSSSISTAACRLPSEARLPSVRPSSRRSRRASCSKSRVMSSSIRTKPLRPAFDFALARRVVHRGHLHAQQPAGRRAGDELRRRAGRAIAHALADALERVGDQRPVEDGVDRAAEADQLGAAGRPGRARPGPELGPGAAVVEQDRAFEVADHDALGQLGHQRRQAAALGLDAAAGQGDLLCDVLLQLRALAQQGIEGRGQVPVGGTALCRELVHGGAGEHRLGALVESGRGDDESSEQAARSPGRQAEPGEPDHHEDHPSRFQHRGQHAALGSLERGPDRRDARHRQERHRDAEAGDQQGQAQRWFQGPRSSISRTFCTSSLVENGLVM